MVRIRLRRMGARKKPFYRIVVTDKRSPRDGRFIETIGSYNPLTDPETVTLKHSRAAHWLSVGAQPSEAVARLLVKADLLDKEGKPIPYTAEEESAEAVAEEAVAEEEAEAVPVAESEASVAEGESATEEAETAADESESA